ncbi:MAG: hypothetical protein ABJE66_16375 [Deltaproteobacteria bacterium]
MRLAVAMLLLVAAATTAAADCGTKTRLQRDRSKPNIVNAIKLRWIEHR